VAYARSAKSSKDRRCGISATANSNYDNRNLKLTPVYAASAGRTHARSFLADYDCEIILADFA